MSHDLAPGDLPAATIIAVLVSAILHAGWNAIIKKSGDAEAAAIVIVAGGCTVSALLAVLVGPAELPVASLPWVALTGVVEGAYFVTLSRTVAQLPLPTAYGLTRGLGVLLVWPLGVLWLGEVVSPLAAVGGVLLSLGLFIQVQSVPRSRALLSALACAATIALYPLLYKRSIVAGVSPFPLFACSLALTLPVQWLMLRRRERVRRVWRLAWPSLSVGGVLCAASFLVFLNALVVSGAAHMSALRNTSVAFALLFGWLLGERPTWRSVSATIVITVGAILVAW